MTGHRIVSMRRRAALSFALLAATALCAAALLPVTGPAPAAQAEGTTYYVDGLAGSDSNTGTSTSQPFKTLAKVNSLTLRPGDQVLLHRDQTYTGRLNITTSATASAWGSGATPVITGGNDGPCVKVTGDDALVTSIKVSDCATVGIVVFGRGDRVVDVTAVGNTVPGVRLAADATDATVTGSQFKNNQIGVEVSATDAVVTESTFANNDSGVNVFGSGVTISHNTFSNDDVAVLVTNAQDVAVHHNSATEGTSFSRLSSTSSTDATSDAVFSYNRHSSADASAQFVVTHGVGGSMTVAVTGTRIRNNTVHLTGSGSTGVTCTPGCTTGVLKELRGNILSSVSAAFTTTAATGVDNVFDGGLPVKSGSANYPYGPGETFTDPLFVDPANGDLHLQPTSPAIDRNSAPSYASPNTDLDGTPVWDGTAALIYGDGDGTPRLDAGAYEAPGGTVALAPGLAGVVSTQPTVQLNDMPYADFATIKVEWEDLEPFDDQFNFSEITDVLRAFDGQAGRRYIQFRLRIMAGINAPTFVKGAAVNGSNPDTSKANLDCTHGIAVYPDSPNGDSGCEARYWTSAAQTEYLELMAAVADQFGTDDRIVDVVNGACTTIFAETFILGVEDVEKSSGPSAKVTSADRLFAEGYTQAKHQQCVEDSTAAMVDLFPNARISMSGHSAWQYIWNNPNDSTDAKVQYQEWDLERDLWDTLRAAHGDHLTIEDHGLKNTSTACPDPTAQQAHDEWYCYMAAMPPTQTHGWQFTATSGTWMPDAAEMGVDMGACYLEFASFDQLGPTLREDTNDALVANCD